MAERRERSSPLSICRAPAPPRGHDAPLKAPGPCRRQLQFVGPAVPRCQEVPRCRVPPTRCFFGSRMVASQYFNCAVWVKASGTWFRNTEIALSRLPYRWKKHRLRFCCALSNAERAPLPPQPSGTLRPLTRLQKKVVTILWRR